MVEETRNIIIYGRYPKYLNTTVVELELSQLQNKWKNYKVEIRTDKNYLDVKKDAVELRKIHKELKQLPRSFMLILPSRVIKWYRGSLTNLVTILHEIKKVSLPNSSLEVTDIQIYEYMHDWKHEQALQTDYLLKKQGRTVGRPTKDVAIETILDMACDGQSVVKIAAHFQVSRMLIWRRIKRTFEETDIYLRNKAKLADKRLREQDPLRDRRAAMSEGRRKVNFR